MAATPAWPPHSAPRLFVDSPLTEGQAVMIDGAPAHYLAQVMRAKIGDAVRLFDDRTGDYAARITDVTRRSVALLVETRLTAREAVPDLWLCAAPIKKARFDFMAEKACELGIAHFVPVRTARAVVDKVKDDRLRAHMIEAAEQCERSALPTIAPLTPLEALLSGWVSARTLFFCDERLSGQSGADLASRCAAHPGPAALLIGPEGGFTDAERALIATCPAAVPVTLGPRILRAETAAMAAIAVWMAANGDWSV